MDLSSVSRFLFPREEAIEPRFRAEIERLSLVGARVIAGICAFAPLLMYVLGAIFLPSLPGAGVLVSDLLLVLVGASALAVSFSPRVARHGRLIGIVLGAATGGLQSWGISVSAAFYERILGSFPQQNFPMSLTIVMLVGIASVPILPIQAFLLGSGLTLFFTFLIVMRQGAGALGTWSVLPLLLSSVVVLISTGLTAILYRQRATAFFSRLQAEESFEALKSAQASLVIERSAAAQSRFAALLSHELNSPLGSLASAFETLSRLVATAAPELLSDPKLASVYEDAVRSGRASFDRLNEVARRMRHFTNLDRAEERLADINDICSDALALLESELTRASVEVDLAPLPKIKCRPQQIGAVISNLVRNAAAAVEEKGRIAISSASDAGTIRVAVRDNGRGIEPDRLSRLFEPSLHVEGGRVAASNWGLFVSRSIVLEHGGDLRIASEPGRGTTATLSLPLTP
jgi:signal transduction histidine kinase